MRVLHFVTGGFSGATQVAVDLCLAAQRTGDQEVLLVLRRKRHTSEERVNALRAQGLDVRVVPGWLHLLTIWTLYRLCLSWKPDVLAAHGFSEHLWGRFAGLLAQVKVLVQVEHNTRERYRWWRLKQSLWLAQRSHCLVGVSYAVRDTLVRLGHPPDLCTAIQNGVDLDRWQPGLPWRDRETAMVMPARFASAKDHATLIRAVALLKTRGWQVPVYLAGDGKAIWRKRAEQLCESLGVTDQVHFLGRVSDLPALMARVKYCVLATHHEGLSLGLIEGMAAGCVGVGSDVEGVQEIMTSGQTGLLVPESSPEQLADAFARLLADDAWAASLAEAGCLHVRQTFDKRQMHQRYHRLFSTLLDRQPALS